MQPSAPVPPARLHQRTIHEIFKRPASFLSPNSLSDGVAIAVDPLSISSTTITTYPVPSRLDDSDSQSLATTHSITTPSSPVAIPASRVETPPSSVIVDASASPATTRIRSEKPVGRVLGPNLGPHSSTHPMSSTSPSVASTDKHDRPDLDAHVQVEAAAVDGAESDGDVCMIVAEHKDSQSGQSDPASPDSAASSRHRRRSTRLQNNSNQVKTYNINVLDGSARPRRPRQSLPATLELGPSIELAAQPSTDVPPAPEEPVNQLSAIAEHVRPARRKSTRLQTKNEAAAANSTEPATNPDTLPVSRAGTTSSRRRTVAVMEDLSPLADASVQTRKRANQTETAEEDGKETVKRRRVSKRLSLATATLAEKTKEKLAALKKSAAVVDIPEPTDGADESQEDDDDEDPNADADQNGLDGPKAEAPKPPKRPQEKKWISAGLYEGQVRTGKPNYTGRQSSGAKSIVPELPDSTFFPLPIYLGENLLRKGRDFTLPFDVMNILPEEARPSDGWVLKRGGLPKSRYVGDAAKEKPRVDKEQAFCACRLPTGCNDQCWNACMKTECDETNCNMPSDKCANRVFATKMTGPVGRRLNQFQIGLEVVQTPFKGCGVRSVRPFGPGEPIAEYTGDIITLAEAQRRQTEDYAHMKNFYMMTLRRGLVVDATKRGSITRFVNHSCKPNCIMDLRIVGGVERVALFAGDQGILTGEEITYDYDFSLFDGTARAQKCFCGEPTCRGFIEKRARHRERERDLAEKEREREMEEENGRETEKPTTAVKRGGKAGGATKKTMVSTSKSMASSVISAAVEHFLPMSHQHRRAKFGVGVVTRRRSDGGALTKGNKTAKSSRAGNAVSKTTDDIPDGRKSGPKSNDVQNRKTPCAACTDPRNRRNNFVVFCDGCPRAFHQRCHLPEVTPEMLCSESDWFCQVCVAEKEKGAKRKSSGSAGPTIKIRKQSLSTPPPTSAVAATELSSSSSLSPVSSPVPMKLSLKVSKPTVDLATKPMTKLTKSTVKPKRTLSSSSASKSATASTKPNRTTSGSKPTVKKAAKPTGVAKRMVVRGHDLVGSAKSAAKRASSSATETIGRLKTSGASMMGWKGVMGTNTGKPTKSTK